MAEVQKRITVKVSVASKNLIDQLSMLTGERKIKLVERVLVEELVKVKKKQAAKSA